MYWEKGQFGHSHRLTFQSDRSSAVRLFPRRGISRPDLRWLALRKMTRVLLINPPSPEQLGAPLLGLQYVAAALLNRGCEVRVIDAAARYFPHDRDWIVAEAEAFGPEIIGFGLFTRWVWHA